MPFAPFFSFDTPSFEVGDAVWCPLGYGDVRGVVIDVIGSAAIVEVWPGTLYRETVRRGMDSLLPRTLGTIEGPGVPSG